jgi:glutathione-independent formaldehyde dehydrogenase
MKGLVYRGTKKVSIEEVPDPEIHNATDAIIRLTTTNICGSDLHIYEGRTSVEEGKILGHENMGIIEEVGPGVQFVDVGDRVSVPFNVACGACRNCIAGWSSFCTRMNPTEGVDGAAYGYANMGPYDGGQAEYLRVPHADFNLLNLPPGTDFENDFTMLSDIFPTGWHGVQLSGMKPGDRVAVFGGGPVGLMAAHSAMLCGASQVFVVDRVTDRLRLAEKVGATSIDFSQGSPVDQILKATGGVGVNRGVEAVGFQAHDHSGNEHPELTLDNLVSVVCTTGGIGVVGVYVPEDPGLSDPVSADRVAWRYGTFFTKGQTMGTGQAPVKRYNRQLRDLIITGRATPSFIVSHEIGLDEAPDAYQKFDRRVDGYTKVLLKPNE